MCYETMRLPSCLPCIGRRSEGTVSPGGEAPGSDHLAPNNTLITGGRHYSGQHYNIYGGQHYVIHGNMIQNMDRGHEMTTLPLNTHHGQDVQPTSDPPARVGVRVSGEIDRAHEGGLKRRKPECKILLLGSGESGKSTIFKQMKIIHQDGFTQAELAEFRPIIYKNVLESANQVVEYMAKVGLECVEYPNRALTEKILEYTTRIRTYIVLPTEIADAIHQLCKDPIIPKIMDEHRNDFYVMDSASYFFGEVLRIGTPEYLPNVTDVLKARAKSVGITETRFNMGSLSIHMFDVGGQRSERKRWIQCFESATSIIFCAALSEYDQVLLEEKLQNRMLESLILFESIVNSRWFMRTSIILFLNKIDVFKDKLPKVPLERYFPEYTGGNDINKAAKYVLWMFMLRNRARLSVYPHLTQATDTTNIRLVFDAVEDTIMQNALRDACIV